MTGERQGPKPITPEDILRPGFVEDLTRAGRIPWFFEGQNGDKPVVTCTILPEGVQFKDKAHLTADIAVRYSSPDGKVNKGWAELITISNPRRNLAQQLRDRVARVFPTLPVEPPYYT